MKVILDNANSGESKIAVVGRLGEVLGTVYVPDEEVAHFPKKDDIIIADMAIDDSDKETRKIRHYN